MEQYNRRQFLTGISAGLAVAGAAAYLPKVAGTSGSPSATHVADNPTDLGGDLGGEPIVAYVRNRRSGEISLFVGSREVTVRDNVVAAKLASLAGRVV